MDRGLRPIATATGIGPASITNTVRYAAMSPVLYRMALASFMGLKWKEKLPKKSSYLQRSNYEERQFEFDAHQRDAEAALGSICCSG
jgi:hypothetical protein